MSMKACAADEFQYFEKNEVKKANKKLLIKHIVNMCKPQKGLQPIFEIDNWGDFSTVSL
jgi:hypothetical protein